MEKIQKKQKRSAGDCGKVIAQDSSHYEAVDQEQVTVKEQEAIIELKILDAKDSDHLKCLISIHSRSYTIEILRQSVFAKILESAPKLLSLLQEKEKRKCKEILQVADHYAFSAFEYRLLLEVEDVAAAQNIFIQKEEKQEKVQAKSKEKKVEEVEGKDVDQATRRQSTRTLKKNEAKFDVSSNIKDQGKGIANPIQVTDVISHPIIFEEKCCICQLELYEDVKQRTVDELEMQLMKDDDSDAVGLIDCEGHYFHKECLCMMVKESHIKCPICSKIYGVMIGDQPAGQMSVNVQQYKCDGYSCNTIVIDYSMENSTVNGKYIPGTWRNAYLPDNKEGREVLALLKIAFERKLIFTIGRSVTTGMDNQVVWSGIHHKTSLSGGSSYFGWPDPTYFDRVKMELALKGVK